MKQTEQRQDVWLHFQKAGDNFTVTLTGAFGSGTASTPIPLGGDWGKVAGKLEQAGFSANRISVLKERLEDHAVAIVGPVNMSAKELAVFGIQQTA
jgi:hypothetical protein